MQGGYGLQGFDPRSVQPSQGGSSLPVSGPDGYTVIITGGEIRPTQNSGGQMLVWTAAIQDGEHQGQSGELRYNVQNPNPQAVEIAFRDISAVSHVVGWLQPLQSPIGQELFNKPFRVIVEEDKNNPSYTRITGYRDTQGNKPGKAGAGPQSAQAPAGPPQPPAGPQGGQPQQNWNQGGGQPQQPAQGGGNWGQPQQQPQGDNNWGGGQQQQPQQQPQQNWGQPQGDNPPVQQNAPQPPQGGNQGGGQPNWGQPQGGQQGGAPGWANQ